MHHPRRSSVTSKTSILGLLTLVAGVLWLAMPGGAQAVELTAFTGAVTPLIAAVVTENASSIGQTTATLNATVNPNGEAVTKCEFEYGTTAGSLTSTAQCASLPGSGTTAVPVTAALAGLQASTIYYFRISATNGSSPGAEVSFTTLPPNPPKAVTEEASGVTQTTATLDATVNPEGSEVKKCEFEYGTVAKSLASKAPCASMPGSGTTAVPVTASLMGLAANTTYYFRITATNGSGLSPGASEKSFTTLPNAPTAVTEKANRIAQTTATLNATVNPNGGTISECKLEYGPTSPSENSVPCSSTPPSGGESAVGVSASATGLIPNTTYHFRISATNAGGTSKGSDETFTTLPNPPTVETRPASSVTLTSATVNATVNPNGGTISECKFEYGPTSPSEKSVPCSSTPQSGGESAVGVSASATGLIPNTTYHFRISATNAGGTSPEGEDVTFTTLPTPTPVIELTHGTGPAQPPATQPKLPRPVLGLTANVTFITGRVQLRVPGGTRGFVAFSTARQIPFGTVVEASRGEVSVTAATPGGGLWMGRFFDGRFVLTQGSDGSVLATLEGGNFSVCTPHSRAGHASIRAAGGHLVRRLWAETGGDFTTRGRYAEGIVQGAQWLTEDLCEGTLVLATRDRVQVADLVHRRQVEVVAGHIDLVKPH